MMDLGRLVVTALGLIAAVNLGFSGRPRERWHRLESPPGGADDPGICPATPRAGQV